MFIWGLNVYNKRLWEIEIFFRDFKFKSYDCYCLVVVFIKDMEGVFQVEFQEVMVFEGQKINMLYKGMFMIIIEFCICLKIDCKFCYL